MKYIILLFILPSFIFMANGQINSGEGTYYAPIDGTNSGNCSIYIEPGDLMYCALNVIDYNNAAPCGGYIKVNGVKGSVVLQVVDSCPECLKGDVDMTEKAFSMIDEVINGRVPITWEFVDKPNDETVKIEFKEGSTNYWTAIKVFDIKNPLKSLEYLDANGNWVIMERMSYNFFVEPAGVMSPMTLRATSVEDEILILDNLSLTSNTIDTQRQFGDDDVLSTSGLEQSSNATVVYPNPTNGIINIKNSTSENWVLYNAQLQLLKQGTSNNIDITSYKSGVYFLKTEGASKLYKVLKI